MTGENDDESAQREALEAQYRSKCVAAGLPNAKANYIARRLASNEIFDRKFARSKKPRATAADNRTARKIAKLLEPAAELCHRLAEIMDAIEECDKRAQAELLERDGRHLRLRAVIHRGGRIYNVRPGDSKLHLVADLKMVIERALNGEDDDF